MATCCGIAVKTEKGYKTIYCHNDGYPMYMWKMLTNNYNSEKLAHSLVSLGDASFISACLTPSPYSGHSFETPEPGVCVFYHRDRGDAWSDVAPANFVKQSVLRSFEYAYIFEDGQWTAYSGERKIY